MWFSTADKEKFRQAKSPPNGRGVQSNGLDSLPRCNQFLTTVSTILIIIRHGKVPWTRERRPRSCARTGGAAALRERDAAAREGIDAAAA